MTMGNKILHLRKARGWSQEELADRIGVSRQAVSRWESGDTKPEADKIIDLCDLFGVSADYLLREQEVPAGDMVVEPSKQIRMVQITAYQILGILLILSSVLLLCALGIMSSVHPHIYVINGMEYRGLLGYILGNRLRWLLATDGILFIVGVLLLIGKSIFGSVIPKVREWIREKNWVRFALIAMAFLVLTITVLAVCGLV